MFYTLWHMPSSPLPIPWRFTNRTCDQRSMLVLRCGFKHLAASKSTSDSYLSKVNPLCIVSWMCFRISLNLSIFCHFLCLLPKLMFPECPCVFWLELSECISCVLRTMVANETIYQASDSLWNINDQITCKSINITSILAQYSNLWHFSKD